MQSVFGTSASGIQLTLSSFLISYGITMFFAGTMVDSYGRYRIVLAALTLFILSNILIAMTTSLYFVYALRILQGTLTALIVVAKRAFLVDIYRGSVLRNYMSLLSIVWALGPITAPFVGGYLQSFWGWEANFIFLAVYAFFSLLLELLFSGEATKNLQPFQRSAILSSYRKVLSAKDFSIGLGVLGSSYAKVLVFAMSAPFIIEHKFHLPPVVTGYCALISGLGIFVGGLVAKRLNECSFMAKLNAANVGEFIVGLSMLVAGMFFSNLYVLMFFVFAMHMCSGFIYNVYFTYCLTRFPENAGVSSGITSGGSYLITSVLSYLAVHFLPVTNQGRLAISYLVMACIIFALLQFLRRI